ncbi:hypothetical protein L917_19680 [Phytophthora nicotianae]|uniref:Uncharacterized protein n=3 Tax=Phytophthora nicotianae TaxID=4792 RepID=V9E2H5_PHYNI|nr:hypothetical protein F443_20505 [Phytophthora nicotianae P1569]ETK73086.1 hypothetical protein L915_19941 [Phytophthora nicotianae]ETL79752.1 hypothetical protein L917_19680 [Phytophthora nicotianae]ETM32993.1 hypothetical protein L914_19721 [Phytophthora nicotianae]ETO61488.1 hypothetical protein F444_20513 [Phytophthora nicotianae P1976]
MNKRLLRSYNMDVLEENNEERINVGPGALSQAKRLTSRDIDVIYAAHNVQTDRSNIDKLFKHAKDGKIDGWLDKVTLEKLTLKDRVQLQETFNQLKNSGITPEKVRALLSGPNRDALSHHYGTMFSLYTKFVQGTTR